MKKIYTILVAVFATTQVSHAQWNYVTGGIAYNAGYVGIGTNPSVPLHVLKSSAAYTNIPMQQWDPSVAGYNLTLSNFNSDFGIDYHFTQYHAGAALPVLTFQSGRVGIGTTAPISKLFVNGNAGSGPSAVDHGIAFIGDMTQTNGIAFGLYNTAPYTPYIQAMDSRSGAGSPYQLVLNPIGGNVGIGTTSPVSKLELYGSATGKTDLLTLTNHGGIANGDAAGLLFRTRSNGGDFGAGRIYSPMVDGTPGAEVANLVFQTVNSGTLTDRMIILGNGNVAIGTSDPRGFKLAVNGSAIAESVTVKLHDSWPDYVFKPAYVLPALSAVKTYIDKYQRLPDMPSAREVEKDGLNLGELVKVQTKKIEELTLYLIEKDNKDKEKDTRLQSQQQQINQLTEQLASITKALTKN